jgi:hypothetical protein
MQEETRDEAPTKRLTQNDLWRVTNLGATCQTTGFVGALNFGADGRPLPTTVRWIGAKHTLVLGHNRSAHWRFYFTNPGILGCVPEAAVNMIVTPPGNTSPILAGRGESPVKNRQASDGTTPARAAANLTTAWLHRKAPRRQIDWIHTSQ